MEVGGGGGGDLGGGGGRTWNCGVYHCVTAIRPASETPRRADEISPV